MASYPADCRSLVEVLRWRAVHEPERLAFSFLVDGERETASLSYEELDRQARAIGAMLQELALVGERALLLYPPGPAYAAAFFGCLYAGVVAVPAYPPRPNRPDPRLRAIVADVGAAAVLTVGAVAASAATARETAPELAAIPWRTTDDVTPERAGAWMPPRLDGNALAFIQYTSGSTVAPRGVMLTHGNLLHNLEAIRACFEHTPRSQGVIWLPPYHDMGLIGGILQPIFAGFPVALMPPAAFLQRPVRWLEAVSRYGATTSGGPDFAFDLCARKVTAQERASLDLSSWRIAFDGAEPIRAQTIDRFVEAFGECGFRRDAFYPCYGLAEATLIVTGGAAAAPPVLRRSAADPPGPPLVGCGSAIAGSRVLIVDAHSLRMCGEGEVGEIWVSGPSVARGYWRRPGETAESFHARLADTGEGPFLRTGDLGLLDRGELFVTGRIKDLIVVRGRNHYPSDIEATAEESHPALRPHGCAAFSVEHDGGAKLVVVQEVERSHRLVDGEEAILSVRRAVAAAHGLHAYGVMLVRFGSIPRTSSGKIRRQACRAAFLDGALEVIAGSVEESAPPRLDEHALDRAALLRAAPEERHALLTGFLRAQWARALKVSPPDVGPRDRLSSLGLDSLLAIDLKHLIEVHFGVVLPMARFVEDLTLEELASRLLDEITAPTPLSPTGGPTRSSAGPQADGPTRTRPVSDVGSLLAREAERRPEAVAIIADEGVLTFGELRHQATRVAGWLRARGADGPGTVVHVSARRPAEMVAGIAGIQLAAAGLALAPPGDTRTATDDDAPPGGGAGDCDPPLPGLRLVPRPGVAGADVPGPAAGATSDGDGVPRAVSHHDVLALFARLDESVGCDASDVLLSHGGAPDALRALEVLWALTRGATVVLASDGPASDARPAEAGGRDVRFSLFYFSSDEERCAGDKYRLLLEGASFADRRGFTAVWTPERHGHRFGGLYPSPSVLGGALAATTRHVRIRAGSVVLPLHDPVRVAEEWSVVDNLSRGRVDVAFARGWNPNDFIFAPQNFESSTEVLFSSIDTVRRLWRGESIVRRNGAGSDTEYRIHPRPWQPELPVWVTCSGGRERFAEAGAIGANVLTALLFQSVEELGDKIRLYREAWTRQGHGPGEGWVTVMLHTFVGERMDEVREIVREPFKEYLASSVDLWRQQSKRLEELGEGERRDLLDFAFERYFGRAALLGTPRSCAAMVDALRSVGVDEIACLIDFGVDADTVLASLDALDALRRLSSEHPGAAAPPGESPLRRALARYRPTLVHCAADEAAPLFALLRGADAAPPRCVLLRGAGGVEEVERACGAPVRVLAEEERRAWLAAGTGLARSSAAELLARLDSLPPDQVDALLHEMSGPRVAT